MIDTFTLSVELLLRAAIVAVRNLVYISVVPASPIDFPQSLLLQSGFIVLSTVPPITCRTPIHYFRVVDRRIGVLLNFWNRQRFLRRIDVILGVPYTKSM